MRLKAPSVAPLSLGSVEAFTGAHSKALGVAVGATMTILHPVGSSNVIGEAALASLLACDASLEAGAPLESRDGRRSTDTTDTSASGHTSATAGIAGSATSYSTGSSTVATSPYSSSSSTGSSSSSSAIAGATTTYCTGSSTGSTTNSSTIAGSATSYCTGRTTGRSAVARSTSAYSTGGTSTKAASKSAAHSTDSPAVASSIASSYTPDSTAITTRARWADSRKDYGAGYVMKQSPALYFAVILLVIFLFGIRCSRHSSHEEPSSKKSKKNFHGEHWFAA